MSERLWSVPIEAVRGAATTFGAAQLARLVGEQVKFRPEAIVELRNGDFIATVAYETSGTPAKGSAVHIPLLWHARENRA